MTHDIIRAKNTCWLQSSQICDDHKMHVKDVVGIVTLTWLVYLPAIILFLILQWHTGVCEETFDVDIKIAQTKQNSWNFIVRKSSLLKKRQTSMIIQEISYSNLETGRYVPIKIWSLLDYVGELTALSILGPRELSGIRYRDGGIMELRWRVRNYRRGLTVGVVLLRFWERYKRIVLNNTRWCSLLLISFNCFSNVIVKLKLDTFQQDGKGLAHEMFFCLTFAKQFYIVFIFVAANSTILFSQYSAKIFVAIIVNWMESAYLKRLTAIL